MRWLSGRRMSPTSWVTLQTVYTQAFGVAVFAIQAPLLDPRAFGLVAIAMVFVSFCESLLDVSTEALISVRDIEPRHYSTMTGITSLFGVVLLLVLLMVSGTIADWFHEGQLTNVLRVMAVLPLLTALGGAPNAETKRAMHFKPLAVRMIAGVTCGGVVGIVLTLMGASVWALVWQAVVQRMVCLVVLWRSSPLELQLSISRRHWHDLSEFTGPLMLSRMMSWIQSQFPRYMLAVHLTIAELGLYSLAARLADIVVQVTVLPRFAVARVALREFATNPAGVNAALSRYMQKMSLLCFPVCLGGAVLMPVLIHAWLNPKWFEAIIPAQLLMLSACTWVTFYGGGALFLGMNQQRSEALMSILQTVTLLPIAFFFSAYGLLAVAAAMAVRPLLLIPLESMLVWKRCHASPWSFLGVQGKALGAAILSAWALWLIRDSVAVSLGDRLGLAALALSGIAMYAALLAAMTPQSLRRMLPSRQESV